MQPDVTDATPRPAARNPAWGDRLLFALALTGVAWLAARGAGALGYNWQWYRVPAFLMDAKSLKKKMKDKAFAASVNRETIGECQKLGMESGMRSRSMSTRFSPTFKRLTSSE